MARATTISGFINLVRDAEYALIRVAGQTDLMDRVTTLRGIYYGMEWSLDYKVEKSMIRNLGFLTYTGGSIPADPRPALGQQLFSDLQASQNIYDRGWQIDMGHVLIGLDTRASTIMRTVPIPGQGGTGLEIVTWLGDLGGGAANVAFKRTKKPKTSVQIVFDNRTSDYGVSENLEGDIGGYSVACGMIPGDMPLYDRGQFLADLLKTYFPVNNKEQWLTRAARFAISIGATVSPIGITNAASLISKLSEKIYDFAVWYTLTRYITSGQLKNKEVIIAGQHMRGAANEVATVFVQALSDAIFYQGNPVVARKYPPPSQPGQCESSLLRAAAIDVSYIRKKYLECMRKELIKLFQ